MNLALPMPPSFDEDSLLDKPMWIRGRPRIDGDRLADLRALYRERAESMRAVDDLVGDIVTALRTNGELDNTVLIFMSDNGYLMGEHRAIAKRQVYEESIRIPLLVSGPGFASGITVNAMVVNQDLAPTIAEIAGVRPGHVVDGRSFLPFLQRMTPTRWRQRSLFQNWLEEDDEGVGQAIPDWRSVRTAPTATQLPDRKFVRLPMTGETELYNLVDDPHELNSRHDAAASAGTVTTMGGWLTSLLGCAGDACRRAEE